MAFRGLCHVILQQLLKQQYYHCWEGSLKESLEMKVMNGVKNVKPGRCQVKWNTRLSVSSERSWSKLCMNSGGCVLRNLFVCSELKALKAL